MRIIRCKCGHIDYYDLSMWLSGGPWCRNCYKKKYEEQRGKKYEYTDLDETPMPTEEMFEIQNMLGADDNESFL